MSEFEFPQAKLPHIPLPVIRNLPQIPTVGCVSGNATTLIGEQMGNLPDISALPQIRALKKAILEQIGALIDGQLPDAVRPPKYAARAARLVSELSSIVSAMNAIAAGLQAEVNSGIEFANQKLSDINAAKAIILNIPAGARTTIQKKTLDRLNEYAVEINAQINRMETALGCMSASLFDEEALLAESSNSPAIIE